MNEFNKMKFHFLISFFLFLILFYINSIISILKDFIPIATSTKVKKVETVQQPEVVVFNDTGVRGTGKKSKQDWKQFMVNILNILKKEKRKNK